MEAMPTAAVPTEVVTYGTNSLIVPQANVSNALRAHGTAYQEVPQANVEERVILCESGARPGVLWLAS